MIYSSFLKWNGRDGVEMRTEASIGFWIIQFIFCLPIILFPLIFLFQMILEIYILDGKERRFSVRIISKGKY